MSNQAPRCRPHRVPIGILYAAAILEFQVERNPAAISVRRAEIAENVDSITGDSIDHGCKEAVREQAPACSPFCQDALDREKSTERKEAL